MKTDITPFGQDKELAGSVLKRLKDLDPYNNPTYSRRDDITISRLFADVFKDRLLFNSSVEKWYFYDGRKWCLDRASMFAEHCAKIFQSALLVYASGISNENDFDDLVNYQKYVAALGDRRRRVNMIADSRDYNVITSEAFDQQPYLFNCQNCVLDLRNMQPLDHDPTLLLSLVSNVTYNPKASSDSWERFITEIMEGDSEKANYIQKTLGYSLTGENTQEEAYMFYGATTRNGKSTLLDTIGYLFGDYGKNIEPETLAIKDRNSRSASEDIARLRGCRFLHMGEPPKGMKFDVALIKKLIGRDKMTARYLYGNLFEFIPVFKLFINTNYLPVVLDDTLFTSERIKVITFDRHFSKEEQDRGLKARLRKEESISGIFNWMLAGLAAFREDGEILREPESVSLATQRYQQDTDVFENFLSTCLVKEQGAKISMKQGRDLFNLYCEEKGFPHVGVKAFKGKLISKGLYQETATIEGNTIRNVIQGYRLF